MSSITNNEHFLRRYRNIRNEYLKQSDKFLLIDYPINEQQKNEVIIFWQNLRNFINMNQEAILNGEKLEFPLQPTFTNNNIKY